MQIRSVLSAALAAVVAATTLTAMGSPAQAASQAQTCSRQVAVRESTSEITRLYDVTVRLPH
ncbi:hypothetical protein [Streptomyces halobius]|uniref:Uncharacterized protein n=1 Tax=Streptomyces halobius TaxID=2879846 RepID=A0ABY4MI06_9ACTN|nr:hypothetical protein [Streptomyces halobius]UQA96718.1 hypothetical protein K9S39_36940 [Streptomyces halobius]